MIVPKKMTSEMKILGNGFVGDVKKCSTPIHLWQKLNKIPLPVLASDIPKLNYAVTTIIGNRAIELSKTELAPAALQALNFIAEVALKPVGPEINKLDMKCITLSIGNVIKNTYPHTTFGDYDQILSHQISSSGYPDFRGYSSDASIYGHNSG